MGLNKYSPQPQPGPAGSFHSQEGHGAGSPLEEPFPAAGTPLGDACGSAAYTHPATMSNCVNSWAKTTIHMQNVALSPVMWD